MDLVVELFAHNTMMNARLLDACRALSAEQLDSTATGTYGSIGRTLVHIANSQAGYAARYLGVDAGEKLPEEPFPGFAALTQLFAAGDAMLEKAAAQPSGDRELTWSGDDGTWRMPVALFLLQAINHSTEHRSQVSTMLTEIGIEPPTMDGWTYFEDSGQLVPA